LARHTIFRLSSVSDIEDMAKRIVFAVWGSLGDLYPYLAIGREMQLRGYHCVIATHYLARARVEAAEFEFAPMGPHIDPDPAAMKKAMHLRRGPRYLLRDLVLPYTPLSFEETVRAIRVADILVTHPIAYGAQIAAEKSGIRWASTTLAPMGFMSAHDSTLRRQSPMLASLTTAGPILDRALLHYARWATANWIRPVRQLRVELGLPRRDSPIFEGQFSPTLTLALFSSVFGQPQPDWPPNTVVTGFPFYREPTTLQSELRDFLAAGAPPVVFTLGSSASAAPGRFFEQSLQAICQLGCRAVLVVGEFAPNRLPHPLPPDVSVFPYAPYSELFPQAAVIVHQGGIGTTAEALRSGRPMLVVPFAYDQPDNAARAVGLGVAHSISIKRYNASSAARELQPLLRDPSYAREAETISERIRAEDGVATACRNLQALLER
jgi:UDP:flavonoid glycosyltransferase YjiC (YdhE family)